MGLLEILFSGAKAVVQAAGQAVREVVRVVLEELDRSPFGRAATKFVEGATKHLFGQASDLAEEERDLAAKYQRDGRRSPADEERLREIAASREKLRKEMDAAKGGEAAKEFQAASDSIIAVSPSDDEASASSGLIASKTCPNCGGLMRLRQGGFNPQTERRRFWWQCTANNQVSCPTVKFDPHEAAQSVLRQPDGDLDGSQKERREIWQRPEIVTETHRRVRGHLGEVDKDIVCPQHLLPMMPIPKPTPGGRLLDSYEYICPGVSPDGLACSYKIPLETYAQMGAMLRRKEGEGIIGRA